MCDITASSHDRGKRNATARSLFIEGSAASQPQAAAGSAKNPDAVRKNPHLFSPARVNGRQERRFWSPDVEIEERDGTMIVRADPPGLTKNDVKVDVSEETLTIEGERKRVEEKKGEGYYRSERSYGRFHRSIALPEGAKPETAKASFANGVLEVTVEVPARKAPAARRLTIEEAQKTE
jgi:HSP20 family molecular chaperone IbpA